MINLRTQITIPTLVRIKPGALGRLGLYLSRAEHRRIAVLVSSGLPGGIEDTYATSLANHRIDVVARHEIANNSFEEAVQVFAALGTGAHAIVGIGGGKALDIAKYVAFLARLPYYAAPTSLSNDGFCSPQSSLTMEGRRRSLPAALPHGVVVDTEICLAAPHVLWLSGVGDLVAKVTAVTDWKLAFHAVGTPVNDFAALLSDATVFQFLARPEKDLEGVSLLATSLMLNGVAMEIEGSSRPASGAEHLISHALDSISKRPRLHGLQVGIAACITSRLQVGIAACITSRLQGHGADRIAGVLEKTGFLEEVRRDPFIRSEWIEAIRLAPTLKKDFYTVLSSRDCQQEAAAIIANDPLLAGCFV